MEHYPTSMQLLPPRYAPPGSSSGCGASAGQLGPELEHMRVRLEQYKKTFPKYEMLGWYSTVEGLQEGDLAALEGPLEPEPEPEPEPE